MLNLTYADVMDAGCEGQLMDTNEKTLISRTAEADINFGKPVVQGAADKGIRPVAAGDAVILGVSLAEASALNDMWVSPESVRVATEGTVMVMTQDAVAAGDKLSVDDATGFFTVGGNIPMNGRFEDSGAAGSLVRIRFDVTGAA